MPPIKPLKEAALAAYSLAGEDAQISKALSMMDSMASYSDGDEDIEREIGELREKLQEARGNGYRSQVAKLEAEIKKLMAKGSSKKDAAGAPSSRDQLEEEAEALRERIRSARAAMAEQSIEEMEQDLASMEAKLGDEADEDEAEGKKDGARLDAILTKVDHLTGRKDAAYADQQKTYDIPFRTKGGEERSFTIKADSLKEALSKARARLPAGGKLLRTETGFLDDRSDGAFVSWEVTLVVDGERKVVRVKASNEADAKRFAAERQGDQMAGKIKTIGVVKSRSDAEDKKEKPLYGPNGENPNKGPKEREAERLKRNAKAAQKGIDERFNNKPFKY